MPVSVNMDIVRMSQEEFGKIAYRVMREVFALHTELGRLIDEQVCQKALAARVGDLRREARISVSFCLTFFCPKESQTDIPQM